MGADNVIEFLIKGDASSADKAFTGLNKTIGAVAKVAGALGVAFSAVKFAEFIKDQINVADNFKKMSEKTGVAIEALSQLDHAFALSGLSTKDMENAFKFLNKSIDDAKTGNIGASDSFASLGISLNDLKKSTPLEVMYKLADSFTQIEDPAARTTMLLEKFGRAGLGLANAFQGGSEGIKKLMAEADRFGLTIDKQFGAAAEEFNDNLSRIGAMATGAGRSLAKDILPVLSETVKTLFDFGGTAEESVIPWGKIVTTTASVVSASLILLKGTIVTITETITGAFQATGQFIGSVAASAQQAIGGNLTGALNTLKEGWNDMGSAAQKTVDTIGKEWEKDIDGVNRLDKLVQNYGKTIKDTGDKAEQASKHKIDPVSAAAAMRLDALRKKLEAFIAQSEAMTATASGNKIALLEAEHNKQIGLIKDMAHEGANVNAAMIAEDRRYAAAKVALQDEMLGQLGLLDSSYRSRQIELAKQTAEQMQALGLSSAQAEGYVNDVRLSQELAYIQAKRSMIDESWMTQDELAQIRYEEELARLAIARENELITKQQHDQLILEAEIKKQAAMGNIQAQAEANRLAVTKMSTMQQLQYTSQALGGITALMQSENKKQFQIGKAAAIAQAIINTYTSAVNAYQSASAIPVVGWILGPIAAAAALALGLQNVNKIRSTQFQGGQAHAGLTDVPREGTYLLDKGERVLSPEQNRDLTGFMSRNDGSGGEGEAQGGVQIGKLEISIQVPNGQALRDMTRREWEDVVSQRIVPALNVLNRKGVRPDFVQRYDR